MLNPPQLKKKLEKDFKKNIDKVFECKAGSGSVTLLIIGLHRGCSKLV